MSEAVDTLTGKKVSIAEAYIDGIRYQKVSTSEAPKTYTTGGGGSAGSTKKKDKDKEEKEVSEEAKAVFTEEEKVKKVSGGYEVEDALGKGYSIQDPEGTTQTRAYTEEQAAWLRAKEAAERQEELRTGKTEVPEDKQLQQAREIYAQASESERGWTNVATLFSVKSPEYIGSFFTKDRTPEDIAVQNLRSAIAYKNLGTGEKIKYYAANMFGNVPTQLSMSYALGVGAGKLQLGKSVAGKSVGFLAFTGSTAVAGSQIAKNVQSGNKARAIGLGITLGLGLVSGVAGYKAGAYSVKPTVSEPIIGLKQTKVRIKPTRVTQLGGRPKTTGYFKLSPSRKPYLGKELLRFKSLQSYETIPASRASSMGLKLAKGKIPTLRAKDLVPTGQITRYSGLRSGTTDTFVQEKGLLFFKPKTPKTSKFGGFVKFTGKKTSFKIKPLGDIKKFSSLKTPTKSPKTYTTGGSGSGKTTIYNKKLYDGSSLTETVQPFKISLSPPKAPTSAGLGLSLSLTVLTTPKVEVTPSPKTKIKTRLSLKPKIAPRSKIKTQPKEIIKPKPKIAPKSATTTAQSYRLTQRYKLKSRPTKTPIIGRGHKTPTTTTPIKIKIPKIDFGTEKPRDKTEKSKRKKRESAYQPSITAGLLNIKAKKKPEISTGFGIRPLIKKANL